MQQHGSGIPAVYYESAILAPNNNAAPTCSSGRPLRLVASCRLEEPGDQGAVSANFSASGLSFSPIAARSLALISAPMIS
jgi:hypothetical protein